MKIGNITIEPWNSQNFFLRICLLALFAAWLLWGLVIYKEEQQLNERLQQYQAQQQLREEQQRREAAYQRRMIEEQRMRSGVQNAVDGFKR